jgi:hypothetical protein
MTIPAVYRIPAEPPPVVDDARRARALPVVPWRLVLTIAWIVWSVVALDLLFVGLVAGHIKLALVAVDVGTIALLARSLCRR